jgi:hypothetical protein
LQNASILFRVTLAGVPNSQIVLHSHSACRKSPERGKICVHQPNGCIGRLLVEQTDDFLSMGSAERHLRAQKESRALPSRKGLFPDRPHRARVHDRNHPEIDGNGKPTGLGWTQVHDDELGIGEHRSESQVGEVIDNVVDADFDQEIWRTVRELEPLSIVPVTINVLCVIAESAEHVGVAIDRDSERMQSKPSSECGRMGCEGSTARPARNAPKPDDDG